MTTSHSPTAAPAADLDHHDPQPTEGAPPARAPAAARIVIGWIFLWAFLDKTFGLGFDTESGRAWVEGGSPTAGFLASRDGSFGSLFQSMSGQALADWAFMGGLAGLGIALVLGIGLRLAAIGGTILMLSMWLSMLPLSHNPIVDVHIVYAVAFIAFAATNAGDRWGLGRAWARLGLVRRLPILR
jgi:thiosulfate dehydrogenase [quinone] large subunit